MSKVKLQITKNYQPFDMKTILLYNVIKSLAFYCKLSLNRRFTFMRVCCKKCICINLVFVLLFSFGLIGCTEKAYTLDTAISDTAEYILRNVKNPQIGSVGGEWAVIGLARSGLDISEDYFNKYADAAEQYVVSVNGILHEKKYTEYSRVALALTAIGKDPRDVGGYDLLKPLGDFEKTVWQGINGAIWALIALDSGKYEVPQNSEATIQATREMYVDYILENQTDDGGWKLYGSEADSEITGMALQALANYTDRQDVSDAVSRGLLCMSDMQDDDAGFSSMGESSLESCVQVLVGLCTLEVSLNDSRFMKNGQTILDKLLSYYEADGGFKHVQDGSGSGQMATEQGFYGLVAAKRFLSGQSAIYSMEDCLTVLREDKNNGAYDGCGCVCVPELQAPDKTFSDIADNESKIAIEALAERSILNGRTDDMFFPDDTMTRAEFAAVMVRGLGLTAAENDVFSDVKKDDWFFSAVNTAYGCGIVNGVTQTEFDPNGTITREAAAVMIARSAALCGIDTEINEAAARDVLAGFTDYTGASTWAMPSLAICVKKNILSDKEIVLRPRDAVTRAEIADMLFRLLKVAKLI